MKRQSGHLQHVLILYAWYHDPSSSGCPVNLFPRLLYYIICQSRKWEIIQPNIYRILPKVHQVTYTLDTICMPNSMILYQAVLAIFCWQSPLWVKNLRLKRGIIPRILWKINQVIYIMYPNSMPDIALIQSINVRLNHPIGSRENEQKYCFWYKSDTTVALISWKWSQVHKNLTTSSLSPNDVSIHFCQNSFGGYPIQTRLSADMTHFYTFYNQTCDDL